MPAISTTVPLPTTHMASCCQKKLRIPNRSQKARNKTVTGGWSAVPATMPIL